MANSINIKHLSKEAKRIWRQINNDFELEYHHLVLLRAALEAFDRLQEARKAIEKDGSYYKTSTGYIREHPALKIEKDSYNRFLAGWKQLGFDVEPPKEVGRPPEGY